MNHNILTLLAFIAINGPILYYFKYIEQSKCGCTQDWRIKYITMFLSFWIVFNILYFLIQPKMCDGANVILHTVLFLSNIVYFYGLYTYIKQLDDEKCKCAIEDNKTLHNILYYYRYLFVIYIMMTISLIMVSFNFAVILKNMKKLGLKLDTEKNKGLTVFKIVKYNIKNKSKK